MQKYETSAKAASVALYDGQKLLAESYQKAADRFNTEISPVGKNFLAASRTLTETDLYDPDLSHPSYAGSVLSVLTHYRTIFKEFPENTDSLNLGNDVVDIFRQVVCK